VTSRVPAAALLAAALALLAACGDDDAEVPTTTTAPPPTSQTTTAPSGTSTTTTVPPEPAVRTITVAFAGGQVVGGATDVTVAAGERVRLEVTSDVAEEVHVHGFDLAEPVGPGAPAELEFVADLPGIWEVELEGSGVELLRLEVQG
jgi:hypothetical protein